MDWRDKTVALVVSLCGGAEINEGKGVWRDSDGTIHTERVYTVTALAYPNEAEVDRAVFGSAIGVDHLAWHLNRHCAAMREALNQECVLWSVTPAEFQFIGGE